MLRAYKYRIYPTGEQKALFAKTFGCCRFVYNWALKMKIEAYKQEKRTVPYKEIQERMVNDLKKENDWLAEVNSQSLLNSILNLDTAYKNFFRNTHTAGFPRFKSRKDRQGFQYPQHCRVDFANGTITIPKAKDIPAVLHRKFKGVVKTVTVSMTPSGKYFASVLVDTDIQELPATVPLRDATLGIDLGIKSLAVCSDGRTFDNPKNLQKSLDRLKLLQKRLSRKQKGSANRGKARIRVARLQEYISNCRKDNLHKITYAFTHDSQVRTICMEDLNVKGMLHNHHLAMAVGDVSFGMFLTQLEYKCKWYGVNLIKIDRFAPSSKTCGKCGHVYKELKLSERSWTCPECATFHDRDFNAACNIKEFGLKALPTERGKVKPVDCPLVDDRPRVLKSNGRKKQEKRGDICISEAAKSLV
ncbi:RNA-guided endonuclease TnpB family protein [Bacteroides fragilis]|jgi:putative transposase|uniref:RNA-guided endonuclease TnpB family protein n=1 Tax=Bacteroides fragilis TaxID=817 RepID=UPI0009B7F5AF|nr:RNA-guided endonuclease TnpB family protein [Bacteroides fragilis]MCM0362337.1 transposase [Bacteroides fragilis]